MRVSWEQGWRGARGPVQLSVGGRSSRDVKGRSSQLASSGGTGADGNRAQQQPAPRRDCAAPDYTRGRLCHTRRRATRRGSRPHEAHRDVQVELSDGDAHALHAEVAETEDARAVRDDDDVDAVAVPVVHL